MRPCSESSKNVAASHIAREFDVFPSIIRSPVEQATATADPLDHGEIDVLGYMMNVESPNICVLCLQQR